MVGQNKKAAHVARGSEFTTPVYHLPLWLADTPHPHTTHPQPPPERVLAAGPGVPVSEWLPSVRRIPVDGTLGRSAGIREADGSGPSFR